MFVFKRSKRHEMLLKFRVIKFPLYYLIIFVVNWSIFAIQFANGNDFNGGNLVIFPKIFALLWLARPNSTRFASPQWRKFTQLFIRKGNEIWSQIEDAAVASFLQTGCDLGGQQFVTQNTQNHITSFQTIHNNAKQICKFSYIWTYIYIIYIFVHIIWFHFSFSYINYLYIYWPIYFSFFVWFW